MDNNRIVVLGAAESGVGAAALAIKKGYDVFVSDMGHIKDNYKTILDEYGVKWEEGQHTEDLILNATEIVKSPGIPDTAPMVVKAKNAGIPIISEIEFAGRYTDAKMICITGSNGKTTTTTLIHHILETAGYNVGLAGNIGRSLALQIAEGKEFDYYVIELSSFQLDNMYHFRANTAILLNITPDHLDRYDNCMQNYTDSKMRILQNQTEEDAFIYWADDPIVKEELKKYDIKAKLCPFSILSQEGMAGYVADGKYNIVSPSFSMEQSELSLKGKHNLYNTLAAGIAARLNGISEDTLKTCLSTFKGVEHRLEKVACVDDVQYINDSKATNVDACWYALDSMTTPTILIIGGKDKGNDYNAIKDLVKEKCAGIVYLGADNTKLHNFFDPMGIPTADTHSMKDCVEACKKMAKPGYTVLLSPCCASFDLFKNMEDRGEQFCHYVKEA